MKILFVAGEVSGDKNASYLIRKLFEESKDLKIYAFGGKEMKKSGAELVKDITEKAVVGFTEVLSSVKYFKNLVKEIFYFVKENEIKKVVLVDFPGFNLNLAKFLKKIDVEIYYFIPPQVWAWGSWRIKDLRKNFDAVLSTFPFEAEFLRRRGVNAYFVGNPIVERIKWNENKENSIIFLPGSRKREIKRHLDNMIKIRNYIEKDFRGYKFYISILHPEKEFIERVKDRFDVIEGSATEYIERSKYAVTVSGTASLECALAGTPMVVIYKVSEITYYLAKMLTKVPYVSLVNIIRNKRIIPEFIQHIDYNGIREFLVSLERDPEKLRAILSELKLLRKMLGDSKKINAAYLILNTPFRNYYLT